MCNFKIAQFLLHAQLNPSSFHRKPQHQGLLGSSPTQRNSLPLGLGTGVERSQTCGVPPFKASPSLKVLNSLLLVISDTPTPLAITQPRATSRLARNFGTLRMQVNHILISHSGSFPPRLISSDSMSPRSLPTTHDRCLLSVLLTCWAI